MTLAGKRTHTRTLGTGKFRCPRERGSARYELRVVQQWASLGTRRVFRLREVARFVECRSCRSTYGQDVLAAHGEARIEDVVTRVLRRATSVLLPSVDALTAEQRREAVIVLQRYTNVPYGSADLHHDLGRSPEAQIEVELRDLAVALNDRGRSTVIDAGVQLVARGAHSDPSCLEHLDSVAEALSISREMVRQAATPDLIRAPAG